MTRLIMRAKNNISKTWRIDSAGYLWMLVSSYASLTTRVEDAEVGLEGQDTWHPLRDIIRMAGKDFPMSSESPIPSHIINLIKDAPLVRSSLDSQGD